MPTLNVDGRLTFYTGHVPQVERGSPLVLLHGAGGTHLHWPPQLRRLPDRAVYALDLPGHGRSAGVGSTSIAAYADFACRIVDELGLPQVVLGGHSMGAAIALQLALDCAPRVAGLALVGASARLRVAPAILDGILTDYAAATALITELAYGAATGARQRQLFLRRLRETDPTVLHDDFAACNAFDVRGRLAEIDVPVLILCGEEDRLTPPKQAESMAAHLPRAELHVLPDAGHMAMLEQPERVTDLIRTFAAQCDRCTKLKATDEPR